MAIHNQKYYGLIALCVSILFLGSICGIYLKFISFSSHKVPNYSIDGINYLHPNDSPQILIDKVFTFLAPYNSLKFDDLTFIEEYCYYLTLEIVTPHDCMINITVTDPEAFQYHIFNTEVNISQDDGWFEIPFGTAISGNYSILVNVICPLNINIHIQLQQEHKCLYDIIPPNMFGNLKFYEVSRYTDGMLLTHYVQMRSDYSYRIFVGRVSSIGGKDTEREVTTFFNLTDPNSIEFQISNNKTLVPIGDVFQFDFGTATGGVYSFELIINCIVECVNIAYAIIEDYCLSDEINGTIPPPDPVDNSTTPRSIVIMPSEFIIGVAIICSAITGIAFIIVILKQKKTKINTNL